MTTTSTLRLLAVGLAASACLTACSLGDAAPEPTDTDLTTFEVDGGTGGDADSDGSGGTTGGVTPGEPLQADGMPLDGILLACEELRDESVTTTDFDIQWEWEFACRTREPFDLTVAGLDAHPALTHTQNAILGSGDYASDRHHWIGELDGQVVDIDLTLTGEDTDFEMTYLVTKRTDG